MRKAKLAILLGLAILALAARPGAAAGSRSVLATAPAPSAAEIDEPTDRTLKHDKCHEGFALCTINQAGKTTTECVSILDDAKNCGGCGAECPGPIGTSAGFVCRGGVCECPLGLTRCGPECVDLQTDDAHCGKCGNDCDRLFPAGGDGVTCQSGVCACPPGYGPLALPTGGFQCEQLRCKAIEPYAGVLLVPQLVDIGSSQYGLEFNVSLGVNPLTNPAPVNLAGQPSASGTITPNDNIVMCFQEDANAAVDLVYKSNNIYSPPAALSSATASNVLKYIDACRVEKTLGSLATAIPGDCVRWQPRQVLYVGPSSLTGQLNQPDLIQPAQQPRTSSAITLLPAPAPTAYPLCIRMEAQFELRTTLGCPDWTNPANVNGALQGASFSVVCGKCTEVAPAN